jgi:N-acetylmuramoyl-L-alanine amidase
MAIKRVYLSPSNQTENNGVLGYNEAKAMHDLVEAVAIFLRMSPMFEVRISKFGMTLQQVCDDSDNWGADLHLCFHSDAYKPESQGSTAFIVGKGGQAEIIARIIYTRIAELSPGKDRGIIVRPGLKELWDTNAPAILIENFFHTNIVETQHYFVHINDYARAWATGIYDAFQVPWAEKSRAEVIVDALCSRGVFTSRQYWLDVLAGKTQVNPEYLQVALERIIKV